MSDSATILDEGVLQVANEITRYLDQREGAADTLEGLVRWWLFRQQLTETEQKISLAVEYLCKLGVINKRMLADGTVLYVAASKNDSNVIDKTHTNKTYTKKDEK